MIAQLGRGRSTVALQHAAAAQAMAASQMAQLSNEEIEACRAAFANFDKDGSGSIDAFELKAMLSCAPLRPPPLPHTTAAHAIFRARAAMGQDLEDEEIFDLIATVDADGSGQIDFPEFLTVILNQKAATAGQDDESDTVDAFIALGGNDDKTGQVSTDKLRGIIKDFGLTIDIERLIRETDLDHSGFIDYDEFKTMMKD